MQALVGIQEGQNNLAALISSVPIDTGHWNEAETRFHFIDALLVQCLGWQRADVRPEKFANPDFIDYSLGDPIQVVWEAKRTGVHFDFPADADGSIVRSISSIFAVSPSAKAAMIQAQGYCNSVGSEFAVVCNGHQLIAFIAQRVGQPWAKGRALVIPNLDCLQKAFPQLWQCLSPDGIAERRLFRLLDTGTSIAIPKKLSASLLHFPTFRYKTDLQSNLRALAELLLEDIPRSSEMKKRFYNECYCDTGALSRDALLSQKILEARYASLFSTSEEPPRLEPASGTEGELNQQIMIEALARRPIVLLGDVGVGKTSFLEDLIYIRAEREFDRAISIYIDLGTKATLTGDLKEFIVYEIDRQLREKYRVDTEEQSFVRGVYDIEIKRFRSSFKAHVYKSNKQKLDDEMAQKIATLIGNKAEHLRRSIEHVANARRRQIVIIIDNCDQRDVETQQSAFLISQDLANNWNAVVFIAVRPQTFFQSKRAGALSAYPHKVLTILPPRPELVLEKRLVFALKLAEGSIPANFLKGVRLHIGSMALFLKALIHSISFNKELREILSNITGGNIRAVIEFVTKFIGSPNVEAEKIVRIMSQESAYTIPIHEFSKAAILGDHSHYNPDSSLAMNLFDVRFPDEREHFLAPMIVAYLLSEVSPKDKNLFTRSQDIIGELQSWQFSVRQIEAALRQLTNKKLIETTERITFEEDLSGLVGSMPDGFRATSIGAYHIKRWLGTFAYIDAMTFDSPIFDNTVAEFLLKNIEEFAIEVRYLRARKFANYLSAAWGRARLAPAYFDWHETLKQGAHTFSSVQRHIERSPGRRHLRR